MIKNEKQYDAIVIGAGNGGLVAAIRLLQNGYKTLVLEKHSVPGGFASSFVRGRFEFEAALHELNDYGDKQNPGEIYNLFKDLGVANKIDWCTINEAYRFIAEDEKIDASMPVGVKEYINKMEEYVPGSKPSMQQTFELIEEIVNAMAYISEQHGVVNSKDIVKKFPNYVKTGAYSINQVLKALKVPDKARKIFDAWWLYLGVDADHLNFHHYALMLYKYLTKPIVTPKLRSHEISLALAERIYELGGEIYYNTPVTKIHMDSATQKVNGVEIAGGTIYPTRYVVANVSPTVVFGSMIDQQLISQEIKKMTNARKLAGRGFSVFLGLNKSVKELGLKDYTLLISKYADSSKSEASTSNQIDEVTFTAVTVLNLVNPEASPKGTTILNLVGLFYNDLWGNITDENYNQMKNKVAKQLITFFEKNSGVKISDCIEEIEIASPVTFARYSGAPGGSIYGYKLTEWDDMPTRLQMMRQDQKIANLLFVGGFSFRGDGYSSSYSTGDVMGKIASSQLKEMKEGK